MLQTIAKHIPPFKDLCKMETIIIRWSFAIKHAIINNNQILINPLWFNELSEPEQFVLIKKCEILVTKSYKDPYGKTCINYN